MTDGAGLAGEARPHRDVDVELAGAVGDLQRLAHHHPQHRAGEIDSWSRPLTVILPLPGLIQTRAMAFLRLPVA